MSSLASLFSVIARSDDRLADTVPCPWCASDDTDMVDHEHQIYQCTKCGEIFERK